MAFVHVSVPQQATLVHDYSMADVNRMAWHALTKHVWSGGLDNEDRYDCAWHAIVVALYSWPYNTRPTSVDLIRAAYSALGEELASHHRHHGRQDSEGATSQSFNKYWRPIKQDRSDGFTEHLVEKLALRDALSVLTALEYEALATLAAFDNDARAAAEALGVRYGTFNARVASGRKRIKVVWYGDETPPIKKVGLTCKSGHLRAEWGEQRSNGAWRCRQCIRAAGRKHARKRREAQRTERLADQLA